MLLSDVARVGLLRYLHHHCTLLARPHGGCAAMRRKRSNSDSHNLDNTERNAHNTERKGNCHSMGKQWSNPAARVLDILSE